MKEDLRIIYMGTPDFAVAPLKALIEDGFNVVGVITAPDKPAGRGQKIMQSAVKQFADQHQIKTLQPTNLKNPDFIDELTSLNANFQIVVAFRMLPEIVWNMPEHGTMNLHASLLPKYRGAAPINWAIINGEKETGVSTFLLKHEIDTGDLLEQAKVEITPNMNAGELHDTLMEVGARLVVKSTTAIANGTTKPKPQENLELKAAPKIFKPDCKVNWNLPIDQIHNFIRGLSPYPAAWSIIQDKENGKKLTFKIQEVNKECIEHNFTTGTILTDDKSAIKIAVPGGFIQMNKIQLEGKKAMEIKTLLNGFSFSNYRIENN